MPSVKIIKKKAHAKINLFLHILDRLPNGYHQIQTIFELVDLHDDLMFSTNETGGVNLHIRGLPLSKQDNLIVKAHGLLRQKTQQSLGVDITLTKRIPVGAGLGGGSSDAAITLLALNELFGLKLNDAVLHELGLSIGADVPVFLKGKSAFAEGIGDKLTPMQLARQYYVILVPHQCLVNTAFVYQHLPLQVRTLPIRKARYSFSNTHNDLESLVLEHFSKVREALQWLKQFAPARLTGSGSAVFAPVALKKEAEAIARKPDIPGILFVTNSITN